MKRKGRSKAAPPADIDAPTAPAVQETPDYDAAANSAACYDEAIRAIRMEGVKAGRFLPLPDRPDEIKASPFVVVSQFETLPRRNTGACMITVLLSPARVEVLYGAWTMSQNVICEHGAADHDLTRPLVMRFVPPLSPRNFGWLGNYVFKTAADVDALDAAVQQWHGRFRESLDGRADDHALAVAIDAANVSDFKIVKRKERVRK